MNGFTLLNKLDRFTMRLVNCLFTLLMLQILAPMAMANSANVTVDFTLGNGGKLIVNYRIPPGLNQLQLPKRQASLRQKQWRIMSGVATLNDQGIKLRPHTHVVQIQLSTKAVTKAPDRVYPLVIPFSDGSVVINTAAFVPVNACDRTVVRFTPRRGQHVVLRGNVHTKSVALGAFCSGPHNGGYAYIGKTAVERHGTFLMVADVHAPTWAVDGIREALQKALASYGSRLGRHLPARPTVYVSFSPGKPHARPWYHGDVLAYGTARLSYVGKSWLKASSAASNLLATQLFIAHEVFHFWNANVKPERIESHGTWLVEGGAQLAALFTTVRSGWLTPAGFLHRLNGDLQRCLLETSDRPWAVLNEHRISGQTYYDCGVVFNLMAAVLINPTHPEKGFFRLWSKLLRVKAPAYSPADFLRIAMRNAQDPSVSTNLEQVLTERTGSLSGSIKRLFVALNIPVRTPARPSSANVPKSTVLAQFVPPLLRAVCEVPYHYGFWTRRGYIRADVPAQCRAFLRTKLLVAIGDSKLTVSPLSAWKKAYAECQHDGTVTFAVLHGNPLSVSCNGQVSKPPRLLKLEAYSTTKLAPSVHQK